MECGRSIVRSTVGIYLSCAAAKAKDLLMKPVSASASTALRKSDPVGKELEAEEPGSEYGGERRVAREKAVTQPQRTIANSVLLLYSSRRVIFLETRSAVSPNAGQPSALVRRQ